MSRPISVKLDIRATAQGDRICCSGCGAPLAPAGQPWKRNAVLSEKSMHGAGGKAYTGAREVLLREFSCGRCGTLLDCEMALPGEPFLDDIVHG